jgi:hypothetical protein
MPMPYMLTTAPGLQWQLLHQSYGTAVCSLLCTTLALQLHNGGLMMQRWQRALFSQSTTLTDPAHYWSNAVVSRGHGCSACTHVYWHLNSDTPCFLAACRASFGLACLIGCLC